MGAWLREHNNTRDYWELQNSTMHWLLYVCQTVWHLTMKLKKGIDCHFIKNTHILCYISFALTHFTSNLA